MSDWKSRAIVVNSSAGNDSGGGWRSRAEPVEPTSGDDAIRKKIDQMNESGDTSNDALFNQLTFGHLPQIKAKAGQVLAGEGFSNDENYLKRRDQEISDMGARADKYPLAHAEGNVVGIAAPMLATGGGSGVAKAAAPGLIKSIAKGAGTGLIMGAAQNPGDTAGVVDPLQLGARAENAKTGAEVGAGIGLAAPVLGYAANKLGNKSEKFAEKSAVNATGATGKQASEFPEDAGRQLLDRKLVRFGDSQEKISSRASDAVRAANDQIDSALSKLEADGVTVDGNTVYKTIRDKITEMRKNPSQGDVADHLEKELEALIKSTDAKGSAQFGVKEAEGIKRGYNRKAGNWADPEKGMAGKEAYQAYRGAVEGAAQAADPKTAALFEEGKKTYGLLAPIAEAAERRASTTSQSPAGGFLDVTSAVAGGSHGGPVGAILAPIARRLISPRLSSSAAVTADTISKLLLKAPEAQRIATENPAAYRAAVLDFTEKYNTGLLPKAADSELDNDSSTSSQEQRGLLRKPGR